MYPNAFRIVWHRPKGSVLEELYRHSMSLRNAVRLGAMPPLNVFNDFMACGYDDVDNESPCAGEPTKEDGIHTILEWEPFSLTHAEYEAFLECISSQGHKFEIKDRGEATYQEWFERYYRAE